MVDLPPQVEITGVEHWTKKGDDVDLFLWEKFSGATGRCKGNSPVRAWIFHGVAANLRFAGRRAAL